MNDKALLGSRIKSAREKLRFSQKDAAARLGIHNSTLGKYELGEREPDIETIKKIAELYEVNPQWIIFGHDGSKQQETAEELLGYLESGLSNEEVRQRMDFFVDIMKLNDEQVDEFMSFVRWQLSKKKEQPAASKSDER